MSVTRALSTELSLFNILSDIFVSLLLGFFSTLLSIRDFMFKAAQTKWISRFVAKKSIQDALMQYDQQLRDAAMSFQVRRLAFLLPFFH